MRISRLLLAARHLFAVDEHHLGEPRLDCEAVEQILKRGTGGELEFAAAAVRATVTGEPVAQAREQPQLHPHLQQILQQQFHQQP